MLAKRAAAAKNQVKRKKNNKMSISDILHTHRKMPKLRKEKPIQITNDVEDV